MSDPELTPQEVPTFSECVVGYRAWVLDEDDRLWPLTQIGGRHGSQSSTQPDFATRTTTSDEQLLFPNGKPRAWEQGINTARCNCAGLNGLSFELSWHEGRRVLERVPGHAAPDEECECGLYSWRRPVDAWSHDPRCAAAALVVGAVASWGRLQVHGDGFRAEHACVVTLAYPEDTDPGALTKLHRVASLYHVELVPLSELEEAASRHGTPLPDSLRPDTAPAALESLTDPDVASLDWHLLVSDRSPDATVEEVGSARATHRRSSLISEPQQTGGLFPSVS